ncbi:MAG TPA: hypothetical protein VMS76_05485, partial [Planctomycetota bacterium]|nr:hypothetical protein [Planctomycetota bacterium]
MRFRAALARPSLHRTGEKVHTGATTAVLAAEKEGSMKVARFSSLSLASALLAGAAGAQATWIVDDDGGPGVHFTDIQPAVDAASSGDVIRVFPGTYSGFILDKALVIVGQPSGAATVQGQGIVRGINAPQKVVLSRLSTETWKLENCTGAVLLDRCDGQNPTFPPPMPGLSSTSCADVRIQQSSFRGPDGLEPGEPGMYGSYSSGRPGRLPAQAPHRSGRAGLP